MVLSVAVFSNHLGVRFTEKVQTHVQQSFSPLLKEKQEVETETVETTTSRPNDQRASSLKQHEVDRILES